MTLDLDELDPAEELLVMLLDSEDLLKTKYYVEYKLIRGYVQFRNKKKLLNFSKLGFSPVGVIVTRN